ncbi:Guanosine polyphosphate pyrophosphohydrolases/synthetases [Dorea longicatena]|nr:Guanosine polyphosphate pyrophosphohydrolases/synthetases [Dorea longicatena]
MLHDTIEDCKDVSEKTICTQFGERVAKLVVGESEDKTRTWVERKSATIEHLKNASEELQMIGLGKEPADESWREQ